MKKFQFKLEGVFKIRKEEERQAKLEVQRLILEERALKQKLSDLCTEEERWIGEYNHAGRKIYEESWRLHIEKYLISLEAARRILDAEILEMGKKIRVAIQKMEKCHRERRQVESLREKEFEVYVKKVELQERKDAEEITLLRGFYEKMMEAEEAL